MLKWIQKEGKTEFGDNWNRILIDPQTFIIEPPHRIMVTVQLTDQRGFDYFMHFLFVFL